MTKRYQTIKNPKVSSIGLIFIIDIALTAISFIASYQICTWLWPALSDEKMLIQLPIIIAIASLVFLAIGSSKGLLKYHGIKEVYSIFNAICLANILTIVLIVVHGAILVDGENEFLIPVSIIIVHSVLSFAALVASRYLYNMFHEQSTSQEVKPLNTLLAGSLKDVKQLISAFEYIKDDERTIVGFLNLDESCKDFHLSPVPVTEKNELNENVIRKNAISEIVIAKSNNFDDGYNEFLLQLTKLAVKVRTTDIVRKLNGSGNNLVLTQITPLKIEDLYVHYRLQADSIEKGFLNYYKDKKILILGAAGCVGNELTKKILKSRCKHVLALDKSDDSLFILEQELKNLKTSNYTTLMADILDKKRIEQVFEDFSPDIVINTAGYKIFDFTKSNLYEAIRLNVLGNKIVSELAIKNKVKKYINLTRNLPIRYCTYARATERIAEIYLNCLNIESETEFINIRFGNVLESPSSVVNVFKNQSAQGGPIKISDMDANISFISVFDLSNLILEATCIGEGGDIFMVDKGDLIRELDLAKQIIELNELRYPEDVDITIAENPEVNENLCELPFTKEKLLKKTKNQKLSILKEDICDTESMKLKINELCIANMLFNEGLIELMDGILNEPKKLNYRNNGNGKNVNNSSKGKHRPLTVVG